MNDYVRTGDLIRFSNYSVGKTMDTSLYERGTIDFIVESGTVGLVVGESECEEYFARELSVLIGSSVVYLNSDRSDDHENFEVV